MRNMIGLRGLFKVFGRGSLEFLAREPRGACVPSSIRGGHDPVHRQPVAHRAAGAGRTSRGLPASPREMLGYTEFPVITEQPYFLTLGPYGFYWFELQGALD